MRPVLVYVAMVAAAVVLFLLIRTAGELLVPAGAMPNVATPSPPLPPPGEGAGGVFRHLLLALTAVAVVGRVLGRLFQRIGQPAVIGDVIGGVLLGPSLLGAVSPRTYAFVLAPDAVPYLNIVAQLGVVFYMFLVGLRLNLDRLRAHVHATVAISHASIVVPFILGAALALYLYPAFAAAHVSFTSFALFLGIAMSITAFPVLARILSELEIERSELGALALTCAAVDDVTAWCLLALVVGIVQSTPGSATTVVLLTLVFMAIMLLVVRPWLAARLRARPDLTPAGGEIAMAVLGAMLAALATDTIGVHALFGAFLFGAVIPHDSRLAEALAAKLEGLTVIVLLPAFFASAGIRTEIGLLTGPREWMACGLIILVASAGKIGATLTAALASGFSWRDGTKLGVLMNTRGLMQLIVLNIGLELGVLTPTTFTMMVLMALVTTLATAPLLRRLR